MSRIIDLAKGSFMSTESNSISEHNALSVEKNI